MRRAAVCARHTDGIVEDAADDGADDAADRADLVDQPREAGGDVLLRVAVVGERGEQQRDDAGEAKADGDAGEREADEGEAERLREAVRQPARGAEERERDERDQRRDGRGAARPEVVDGEAGERRRDDVGRALDEDDGADLEVAQARARRGSAARRGARASC